MRQIDSEKMLMTCLVVTTVLAITAMLAVAPSMQTASAAPIRTITGQGDAGGQDEQGNDLGLLCTNSDGTPQFFWNGSGVTIDFETQVKPPAKKAPGSWKIINQTQGDDGTKSGTITLAKVNKDGSFTLTGVENTNTLCNTPLTTTITITGQCSSQEQILRFSSADGREVGTFSGSVSCQ
jgi:hypothetical protein